MTTFYTEETNCPVCDSKVKVRHLQSTNTFGRDTDFRTHTVGADPLHLVISICQTCGYSDYGHYFDNPRQLSNELKQRVRETLSSPQEDQRNAKQAYANAALIATWRGAPANEIADLHLRAAWCCADQGDGDGEITHRKAAIEQFEQALENGEIEDQDRPVITYLIGELYRRVGDVDSARILFDKVLSWANLSDKLAWLPQIAEQQRNNPQSRFAKS